jgi:hypothetical protein
VAGKNGADKAGGQTITKATLEDAIMQAWRGHRLPAPLCVQAGAGIPDVPAIFHSIRRIAA